MKKLFSLFLALVLAAVSSIGAVAAEGDFAESGKTVLTIGDWVYSAIGGGSYWELDEYVGEGGDVIVPRIVNNMMVTNIGSHCFLENKTVKSVSTSSPLWTVDEYAFLNCTSLERFECNFAMKEIGVGAFIGTSSLRTIDLERSVVEKINAHTFMSSGITEITLPETCKEIAHDAFSQCENLRKIVIPRSVEIIDDDAFKSSNSLVIYCYTDSAAHTYAVNKGIPFKLIDGPLMGDANIDGEVDVRDVTAIQKHLVDAGNLSDEGRSLADVNHDGDITIRDATLIQMAIVGLVEI